MVNSKEVLRVSVNKALFSVEMFEKIGEYVVNQAKMYTEFNAAKTTKISEKISYNIDKKKGIVIINVDSPYAMPLEFGSDPHVIRPKYPKKALAWTIQEVPNNPKYKIGDKIVVKKVNHKGSKASPFLRPAIQDFKLNAAKILND